MAILKDTVINGDLRINGRITPAGGIYFGVCSTAAATQAKTVDIPGITEYYDGLCVRILFTNAQDYSGAPTLNINGLGALTIRYRSGTNAFRYVWNSGTVRDFVIATISGVQYFIYTSGDTASTTYYGITQLNSSLKSTSAEVAATPRLANRKIIGCSEAFSIPAEGQSITKSHSYMTAAAKLVCWNFSESPENQPPCDLSWSTAEGSFTITNNGGSSNETICPDFIFPLQLAWT